MASGGAGDVVTEKCTVEVGEPPGYWRFHRCTRTAKFTITTADGIERGVCGIHMRQNERIGLASGNFIQEQRRG